MEIKTSIILQWENDVRNNIKAVANASIANVSYVDCAGLVQHDRWHFNAAGQKYLGESFIKELKEMSLGLSANISADGNLTDTAWSSVNKNKNINLKANGATVNIIGTIVDKGVLLGITVTHTTPPETSLDGSNQWHTYLNVIIRINGDKDFYYTTMGKQNVDTFIAAHKTTKSGDIYTTTFEYFVPFSALGVTSSTTSISFATNGWVETGWCWFNPSSPNWNTTYTVTKNGITTTA